MQRYGGELIYHGRDEDGALEVVDSYGIRALHFGTPPRQSALSLRNPSRLELAYIRAMLSPLPFIEEPRRVLLAGLGGGSLARFLLEEFPGCQVEAVERRAGVVAIAHDYFGLPRAERLRIHVADASQQLETLSRHEPGTFDLILVDVYDHLGMDASVNAPTFLGACAELLSRQGALSMNLWGTHPVALRLSTALLKQFFPGRAFRLAVPNRGNVIGLGLGKAIDPANLRQRQFRARELEIRSGLEMSYFLRNLRPIA
jgi:spermidine synthase